MRRTTDGTLLLAKGHYAVIIKPFVIFFTAGFKRDNMQGLKWEFTGIGFQQMIYSLPEQQSANAEHMICLLVGRSI